MVHCVYDIYSSHKQSWKYNTTEKKKKKTTKARTNHHLKQ